MSRPASAIAIIALLLLAPRAAASPETDAAVERYLEARGLDYALATQLEGQLVRAAPESKPDIANRLGAVYIRLLENADPGTERRAVEERARTLIAAVPDADTAELEVSLIKAGYLIAESSAERWRLRLADVPEREEAIRVLRGLIPRIRSIAQRAHRQVESLERRESVEADVGDEVRAKLAGARRVRSLAYYYLGWSRYYLSYLTGDPREAMQAVEDFGWLLNANPGQPADLERFPADNLRYDHVARAAIGTALCYSLFGENVRATRWLEAVDQSADTPDPVRKTVFARTVIVHAAENRWDDIRAELEYELNHRPEGLTLSEARLIAVLALESGKPDDLIVASVTRRALESLVALGAAEQILDLMDRYGSADLPGDGFVPRYVRALRTFNAASEQLGDAGVLGPAADPALANRFADAARALEAAAAAEDADRFPEQLERCRLSRGAALVLSGRLDEAAQLLQSLSASEDPEVRERAAWLAISALDAGADIAEADADAARADALRAERDRFAARYVATYPGSARAISLVLSTPLDRLTSPDQAVRTLLAVPPADPLFVPARERAADLLYRMFRSGAGAQRDTAGLRFLDTANDLVRLDTEGSRGDSARALGRLRQSLDVALGLRTPDTAGARRLLDLAQTLPGAENVRAELLLRRLQIALLEGQDAENVLSELRLMGGDEARTALKLVFSDARAALSAEPTRANALRVIDAGESLLEAIGPDAVGAPAVSDEIAGAASMLAALETDPRLADEARAQAVRIDARAMERGEASRAQLRRLALNAEETGDAETALAAWVRIMAGTDENDEQWYQARYESFRLQAGLDPDGAREALRQHAALNPELGPEPWGGRIGELGRNLGVLP